MRIKVLSNQLISILIFLVAILATSCLQSNVQERKDNTFTKGKKNPLSSADNQDQSKDEVKVKRDHNPRNDWYGPGFSSDTLILIYHNNDSFSMNVEQGYAVSGVSENGKYICLKNILGNSIQIKNRDNELLASKNIRFYGLEGSDYFQLTNNGKLLIQNSFDDYATKIVIHNLGKKDSTIIEREERAGHGASIIKECLNGIVLAYSDKIKKCSVLEIVNFNGEVIRSMDVRCKSFAGLNVTCDGNILIQNCFTPSKKKMDLIFDKNNNILDKIKYDIKISPKYTSLMTDNNGRDYSVIFDPLSKIFNVKNLKSGKESRFNVLDSIERKGSFMRLLSFNNNYIYSVSNWGSSEILKCFRFNLKNSTYDVFDHKINTYEKNLINDNIYNRFDEVNILNPLKLN